MINLDRKMQASCQLVAAFAKKLGRVPNHGVLEFDIRLLKHIMDTREEALIAAACLLVQENVSVIDA